MAVIKSNTVTFLPAGTEVLFSVKPDGDITPKLIPHLEVQESISRQCCFVRARLLEDLNITYKLHDSGNISKELEQCRCEIPALSEKEIISLNQAYQEISAVFEPWRASRGGRVYDHCYYQDDRGKWILIEKRREKLYQPYKTEYEKRKKDIQESNLRYQGVRLPDGICIIIRKDSEVPITYSTLWTGPLIKVDTTVGEDGHLIVYGPFDQQSVWSVIQNLEKHGLIYGKDFVHFHNTLPDWCRLMVLPV